jgi:hypothetical protein
MSCMLARTSCEMPLAKATLASERRPSRLPIVMTERPPSGRIDLASRARR